MVEDGSFIPLKRECDQMIPKVESEITDEDGRRMQTNDKAMHMMFCVLRPDEYIKMAQVMSKKQRSSFST
ncbi:hypothetical protein GQ457_12G011640 [Hibiscus cannabinus]